MTSSRFLSWGNYPPLPQAMHACHWRDSIPGDVAALAGAHGSVLPVGNGRSYGDSCLAASGHVLGMSRLDRFIRADWEAGILVAEAGASFGEILAEIVPRGWFLPVTPGTRFVTLGGAIANDVHGKNHTVRGTFGRHVRSLGLFRSHEGRKTCSPAENDELFSATIGGLGLTGVIEWAEVQLLPIRSSTLETIETRFDTLVEYLQLSAQSDQAHEYGVAWIDCTAKGKALGRGVHTAADFSLAGRLEASARRRVDIPATPPVSLVNGVSIRAMNALYRHARPRRQRRAVVGYEPYFYPLDGIGRWNRLYGPRGFQQHQSVIPEADAESAIVAMLAAVADSGAGTFLAVLKRFGTASSPGLLSFPRPGITLALDFAQEEGLEDVLFPRLDAITREAGGRLYPAKDAHMRGEDFRRAYPDWQKVEALRDPALSSRFWKRVTS